MSFKHNDYEVLSLLLEGNEEALSLMFEKYSPLIYKMIIRFNLMYDMEDMYQESLMILHQSIKKFNPEKNKSFTRYFEMILERKFISIVTKRVRRQEILEEHKAYISEQLTSNYNQSVYIDLYRKEISKILTKTENLVYTLRELQNYSITYIKEKYDLDEKVIYNSLYRAKAKIKDHFKN